MYKGKARAAQAAGGGEVWDGQTQQPVMPDRQLPPVAQVSVAETLVHYVESKEVRQK